MIRSITKPPCPRESPLPKPVTATDPPTFDAIVPSYVDLEALTAKTPRWMQRFFLNAVMRSDDTTLTHHAVRAVMGAAFLPE